MAKFRARFEKVAADGARVVLYQVAADGSWFVGAESDPWLHPIPLGGFCSREAARKWADSKFADGEWRHIAK
jgi:hypothetical protein